MENLVEHTHTLSYVDSIGRIASDGSSASESIMANVCKEYM